jgi:t-SNARE complex subunit (syntaxin)
MLRLSWHNRRKWRALWLHSGPEVQLGGELKNMSNEQPVDRAALLEAAAAAEHELIDAEIEAEQALSRAEARLAKITGDFERLEREVRERTKRVDEARAMLTAVQKRRADGPERRANGPG